MLRLVQIRSLEKFWLFLLVLIPVVFTGLAWWAVQNTQFQKVNTEFHHLALANEKALQHRMDSYAQALLGGKGFFQGSTHVTRHDWREYTLALNVYDNFPGINGIGLIVNVPKHEVNAFKNFVETSENITFNVRPKGKYDDYYVIYYIEPIEINREAVGLNIAFEANRRSAANLAMQTGMPAITKRILLVQDVEQTPGFLLLLPVDGQYVFAPPLKDEFSAWIYAPFIAKNFMENLTQSQGRDFRLEVFDEYASPDTLIFDSEPGHQEKHNSLFTVEKTVEIMQQKWLLRWSSTETFEANNIGQAPFFVLLFGSIFTMLVCLFLFLTTSGASSSSSSSGNELPELKLWVPNLAFIIVAIGAVLLHNKLYDQEQDSLDQGALNQLTQFEALVSDKFKDYEQRLDTVAHDWALKEYDNPSNLEDWQASLSQSLLDMHGLQGFAFVDVKRDEILSSLMLKTQVNLKSLIHSAMYHGLHERIQRMPKASLMSGFEVFGQHHYFVTVHPVIRKEQPVAYMFAAYNFEEFARRQLRYVKVPSAYHMQVELGEERINFGAPLISHEFSQSLRLAGNVVTLRIYPNAFTSADATSYLPKIILLIGLAAALLIAMVIHFVQQLKINARVIDEKQNLLATFIKHAPMSLAMFDREGNYMVASTRWFEFYNLIPNDVIGHKHPDPNLWIQQGQEFNDDDIMKLEEKLEHSDGSLHAWMRYVVCHWFKDTGESGGIIVFAENITEEKNMALMKNEFVSTVNHELRTPLTAIQGALGLLQMGAKEKLEAKYQKLLKNSFDNCKNLTRIVNDILDLEKMAAGELTFEYENTQLSPLIEQAVSLNEAYAQKYNVEFQMILENKPITVWVDPNRLLQCLSNLLSNAAKFSNPGDSIYIRSTIKDDQVCIEVEDCGAGIPLSFQAKVFQRFAQANGASTRAQGGTGLGLSITQSLIHDMGGDITFRSQVGHGTTFYISLPIAKETDS